MNIFVQDSFTDVDGTLLSAHTPDIGGTWFRINTFIGWDLDVFSNQLRNVQGGARYINRAQTILPDIDVSVIWVAGGLAGVNLSHELMANETTGYRAHYNVDRYGLFVRRTIDGALITLAELVEAAPSLPVEFRLQFRQFGTPRLILTVNGVQKLTSDDRTVEQCFYAGLHLAEADGVGRLDNFLAIESPTFSVQYDSQLIRAPDRVISY